MHCIHVSIKPINLIYKAVLFTVCLVWRFIKAPGHPASRRPTVPYVKVEITREGATQAQKEALIGAITQALTDILGKDPEKTFVTIAEIGLDDWGIGGQSITARRQP